MTNHSLEIELGDVMLKMSLKRSVIYTAASNLGSGHQYGMCVLCAATAVTKRYANNQYIVL